MGDIFDFDKALQSPLFHAGMGIISGTPFPQAWQQGMQTAGGMRDLQFKQQQAEEMEKARLAEAEQNAQRAKFAESMGYGGMGLTPSEVLGIKKQTEPQRLDPIATGKLQLEREKFAREIEQDKRRQELQGTEVGGWAGGQNISALAKREGFDEKGTQQAFLQERRLSDRVITEAKDSVRAYLANTPEITRIEEALDIFNTGKFGDGKKTIAEWASAFGGDTKVATAVQEIERFQNKIAIESRQPGSGPMSDNDFKVLQGLGVNINNTPEYNRNYLGFLKATQKNNADYSRFLQIFFDKNGTTRGAENAWRSYVDANPILISADENTIELNKNRQNWRKFFKDYDPTKDYSASGQKEKVEGDVLGIL